MKSGGRQGRPTGSSGSAERRKRVIPISFQLAGATLNLASLIHNEWASGVLAGLWFTVFQSGQKPWVKEFWDSADERIEITVDGGRIPVYCWGQGPLVVTMHGWSGSGTQFRQFIDPLVAGGFRVACFDAPAHGDNPGRRTHLINFSASLFAIEESIGRIDCVIAHSLGAMAAVYAMQQGLAADRAVLVAPHLDVQKMFETYRDLLGMRSALANRFHDKIGARMESILNDDPWEVLNPGKLLSDHEIRGLLVYDHRDPEVPQALFDEIIDLWGDCEVLATEGLGHNRILKDAAVIDAVVDYLKS